MNRSRWRLSIALGASLALCGAFAGSAAAHSSISPAVAQTETLQQFTLDLQAEKEVAFTNKVQVTFPDGFNVETFAASPGWRLNTVHEGIGEQENVTSVTWTGREQ